MATDHGWICPKCGRCYAPICMECPNCNGVREASTDRGGRDIRTSLPVPEVVARIASGESADSIEADPRGREKL